MHKRMLTSTLLCGALLFTKATGAETTDATHAHDPHSDCVGQTTGTDLFAGFDPIQRRLMENLVSQHADRKLPLALCFAPGTPDDKIAERYAALEEIAEFRIHPSGTRWTATATDGNNIQRGVPITLRWSFIEDGVDIGSYAGEPAAPSNLKAFLNGIYGNQTAWQSIFQQVFDRWTQLSGVTYVYEPNDDGASFPTSPGVVGVRGDVRIGGHYIDGNSNTLAYNFYPITGDMVIDTGDVNFYSNMANGSLGFRNVVAHEAGHGLGFEHVCPVNQTKLMEPFVSTSFNGPQHDDLLAVHRNYGDRFGVISTTASAPNLGTFANQTHTTTNLSIDGSGEVDIFKFSVAAPNKRATVTLTPIGFSYLEGAQSGGTCSPGTTTNTLMLRNLGVELLDSNGTTILATANSNPSGQSETFTNVALNGTGPYYVRISGDNVDMVQLYQFSVIISDPVIAVPVLIAEPATTPGTQNTIFWHPVAGAITGDGTATGDMTSASLGGKAGPPRSGTLESAPVLQNILTETFESGNFPSGLWTVSGNPTWNDVTYDARNGVWSVWCAGSTVSPASGYVDNMNSRMSYGPFSLEDATSGRLKFWFKNDSEPSYDHFKWSVSTNGIDFVQVGSSTGFQGSWAERTVEFSAAGALGNLIGRSQVWIAFEFTSDFSYSGDEGYMGAYVDDVVIEKEVPSLPDLTTYLPGNWNDKLPIGTAQLNVNDSHSYNGPYYDHHTFYFNWASINSGTVAAGTYTVRAEVTGTGGGSWTWTITNNPVNQWFGSTSDRSVGPLAAGAHTFKVWVDYNSEVTEINEANNYYERTIIVGTMVPVEYYAEASANANFTSPVGSGWISSTQYTFQNLTAGQTYWYRVKARQGAGNESSWSASVSSTQETGTAQISVGPSSQSFNTIQVGSTADRTFVVTNSGAATLSGNASVPSPFSIVSGGTYNLTAGQSQSVVVRYTPLSAGSHSANVTFTGGGGATRQVSGAATNANTPPTVTITLPTTNTSYSTNANMISLAGTASDNVGVSSVSWTNNRGGGGAATGTASWSVPAITLQPGTNVITVTAQDASLATGSDSISVVFIPPNVFHTISKVNGQFQFTLSGEVGRRYVVQYSTNLVQWPTLVTLTNTTGSVTYTDVTATNGSRFYRSYPE